MKALFQVDLGQVPEEQALAASMEGEDLPPQAKEFARQLLAGTIQRLSELDQAIASYARGWSLERMARLDLNLLRLAAYEILYRDDIPPAVTVNEAVELVKRYSTADSGRFINGILGSIVKKIPK